MFLDDLARIFGTRVGPYASGGAASLLWALVAWGITGTVVASRRLVRRRGTA